MVQGNIENIGDPVDRLRRVLRGESPPEGDWLQDKIKDIKNHAKVGDMYVTKIPFKLIKIDLGQFGNSALTDNIEVPKNQEIGKEIQC